MVRCADFTYSFQINQLISWLKNKKTESIDTECHFSFFSVKSTTTTLPSTLTIPTTTVAPKLMKLLKSCSDCKLFEKELSSDPTATVQDNNSVAGVSKEILKSNSQNPNNVLNQIERKNVAEKSTNEFTIPKMRVKSDSGSIGLVSPMNIALGISAAGIKASKQFKSKQKEFSDTAKIINDQSKIQPQLKPTVEADNTKTLNVKPLSEPSQPNQIQSIDREVDNGAKTSHQISKPIHSTDTPIPVSLQTKSEFTVPISIDRTINNKPVELAKTHLSSKKAIDEFIGDVLYRFNYTAGFHGHNEEGDSAGNKRGGYFIVGRDNVRRGVIYVANSNGFVPMVKYEKVSPAEAPHEDTEKNVGLRGYEFEWFHKGKSKIDSVKEIAR